MYKRMNGRPRSLQRLWRYLSYERLRDLLRSGELFFAHLSVQSDSLEGTLTERTRARLFNQWLAYYGDDERAAATVTDYENHREGFFVNCWHMNEAESYLMWRAYGDRGYAIQTTLERLEAAFDPFPGLIQGCAVDYIDFSREVMDIGNVFTAVTKKDLPYRDEREFRLLFWRPDPANSAVRIGSKGVRVQVDLGMLIDNIYVSPQVKVVPDELRGLIAAKNLLCSVQPGVVREK